MDLRPATDTGTRMAGRVPRKRVRVSDRAPVFRSTCGTSLVGRGLQFEALVGCSLSAQGLKPEPDSLVANGIASRAVCHTQLRLR